VVSELAIAAIVRAGTGGRVSARNDTDLEICTAEKLLLA